MKWSNIILSTSLVAVLAGIFGSNVLMKKEYNRLDKSDKYWNYTKLTDKPFRHIRITGGNVSNIVYEQTSHNAVKVLRAWHGSEDGTVKAEVTKDTLQITFLNQYKDLYEKYWLKDAVTVRITGPVVESISGSDTKVSMNKFNQPSLKVNLTGNSKLIVSSYRNNFDKIDVSQADSSVTTFTMSNETFTPDIISIREANVTGRGVSLLNLRSSSVQQLNLDMSDSASVALSGYTLDKWSGKK